MWPTFRRSTLVRLLFALALVTSPLAAEAQPTGKMLRVGVVAHYPPWRNQAEAAKSDSPFLRSIRQGLLDAGYIEGKNLLLEIRGAGGDPAQYSRIVTELLALNVDVIVAGGSPAAVAVKRLVQSVPVVVTHVSDPVGLGLVSSLARPGGNVTGISFNGVVMRVKSLELLKQAVPSASRIISIYDPKDKPTQEISDAVADTAHRLGMTVLPDVSVPTAAEVERP